MQIWAKNRNLGQKLNLGQKKKKFGPNIEIWAKNRNEGQKSKGGPKMKCWPKSKFSQKIKTKLFENRIFYKKMENTIQNYVEIINF